MTNHKFGSYGGGSKRRPRIVALVLVVVLIGAGFLGYRQYIRMVTKSANSLLAAQVYAEAEKKFNRASRLPLSGGTGKDGLGALALLRGDREEAKAHFAEVLARKPGGFGANPALVFTMLLEQGKYRAARDYMTFLENWKKSSQLDRFHHFFAATFLGLRDLDQTQAYLDKVDPEHREAETYQKVSATLEQYKRNGEVPIILDRHGKTLFRETLATGERSFVSPALFSGWMNEGKLAWSGHIEEGELNVLHTTLDLNLQRSAYQAMQGYAGTLVLVDPSSGEILSAFGTEGQPPFNTSFEPGSVIKILTYAAFLSEGLDTSLFAPLDYPGNDEIGGKIFYDWTTHGKLATVNEGMAVSCNLMFARMGIELGWSRLQREMSAYLSGPTSANLLLEASNGTLLGEPDGAWELGRAAIGLDFPSATALGLVRIPATIANGGRLVEPWILNQVTNHQGAAIQSHEPNPGQERFSAPVAAELSAGMSMAVTSGKGTARRAEVPFASAAMKTGTAGDRPFDSIMIGFFPQEQPQVAFAFFLNQGGKCEIHGARVAKRLLEQIKALAPEYLGR